MTLQIEKSRKKRTLQHPVTYSGIGLHTGKEVTMRFSPEKEGTGIYFKRVDLAGAPIIPARVEYVVDTSRSTNIGINDIRIYTVEHVLAALRAYEIDNVCIELSSVEPPIGDGSSRVFIEMIEEAGIQELSSSVSWVKLKTPVVFSDKDVHIVAVPSDEYRISYTLSYPNCPAIRSQYCSVPINQKSFKDELSMCRTFALYEELSYLIDNNLIQGASLDNAVVIKGDAVISRGGLRYPDEMARHKILDIVGDFSLVGMPVLAHIIAIRSGHASNIAFAKQLLKHISQES